MNIKKRWAVLGIMLLAAAWCGNIIYYENHKLKEPIFIKHYYDIKKGMSNFTLYYIQNINATERVSSIIFPEISEEYMSSEERDGNSDSRYYILKQVGVSLYRGDSENIPDVYKNKVITKAKVLFTNGRVMNVDIGKIYLYNDEQSKPVLQTSMASGGSDNTGYTSFAIDRDTRLKGIYCKFPELVNDILKVSVNDRPLNEMNFPIDLKYGSTLKVGYGFKLSKNDIRANNAYNFSLDILTEDTQGKRGYSSCYLNYWNQFPDQFDIKAMLKDRGRD